MKRNTILFTISSAGTTQKSGKGGHFRSLQAISLEIAKTQIVYIVYFGKILSPVFKDQINVIHININSSFYSIRNKLNTLINEKSIDVIHAFDEYSYVISLLNNRIKSIFLTKCGGINQKNYPFTKNMILFSKENLEYYNTHRKFKNSNILLITNRVIPFENDNVLIKDLANKIEKKSNEYVILRISRILPFYEKSIEQSINLYNFLKNNYKEATFKLLIIGEVYDEATYERILNKIGDNPQVYVLQDDKYTNDAKKIINIADIVIGAGRSLMEAAFCKKIIFALNDGNNLPTLMNNESFDILFKYNFSSRVPKETTKYNDFNKLFKDPQEAKDFSFSVYEKYFSIKKGADMYIDLYNKKHDSFTIREKILLTKDKFFYLFKLRALIVIYGIKGI